MITTTMHTNATPHSSTTIPSDTREWEMLLKLRVSAKGEVCARVKTPEPIREISAGPCAQIGIGVPFSYRITIDKELKLDVVVASPALAGGSVVIADAYDYSFLTRTFLDSTRYQTLPSQSLARLFE